jgi:SAM-dependent methyltransferase
VSQTAPPAALLAAASAYYKPAGPFARHFAHGKLKADPAFQAILEQGLLAGRAHLLDLGAGQGLLAAWLLAARSCHASERAGAWPRGWPAPPDFASYLGIEINPQEVRRARRAFALATGAQVQIVHGDIRDVDYGTPDAVVILDVLHYNDYASQERILARVRAVLVPGGLLLMRIGDADGGLGFTLSKALDRTVVLARRGRWTPLKCRALKEWLTLIQQLGFATRTVPMSKGAPFTNVLLLAQVP